MNILSRIVTSAAVLAAFVLPAGAQSSSVDDLDIRVVLNEDGSARITEVWDVEVYEGTEWYLVRENLGDIEVSDLSVTENGIPFRNEGAWDVDRGIAGKAQRCGIVSKSDGCEICWGLGSHGRHVFTASYTMSNVVKTLEDFDMVHMQFVSPGLSSAPEHVKVTISSPCIGFDSENSRIWGFGYVGSASFEDDGTLVFESGEPFRYRSSVISLVRIDKGYFHSPSVQSRTFDTVLEKAKSGSDWEDGDSDQAGAFGGFAVFLGMLAGAIALIKNLQKRLNRQVLGVKSEKEIQWSRDIPYGGDIQCSEYVIEKLGKPDTGNRIAAAMILRMVNNGNLVVRKTDPGSNLVDIAFAREPENASAAEAKLYSMMKEASGEDEILQDKEFSRWSKRHKKEVHDWIVELKKEGREHLVGKGYLVGGKHTAESQANARTLIGLRKFLSDNTLSRERSTSEVTLWQDYLVFAALFGIADKVARELRDIDPKAFEEAMPYDYGTTSRMLHQTMVLSRAITNSNAAYESAHSGSAGGFGGHSSFGGGGGFSGGGFGGGAR